MHSQLMRFCLPCTPGTERTCARRADDDTVDSAGAVIKADGSGVRARALFDYQAMEEGELTFDPDDVIIDIVQLDEVNLY